MFGIKGHPVKQSCDWSVEQGGRGIVNPERLDGGEDFLLVASEGHAHSKQVSMETDRRSDYYLLLKTRGHVM